ncbi:Uncharacterized protein OBRU01_09871 [Operophtera brumata]|uniref:Uncharacterized protein n=1 Tax=Operophtera brumata TaxID=104452 RepID=A0A0L7LFU8_OPEBR|nr:Uncharacterized protein OBRU01_09871 [Operophtera brumata]
MMVFVYEFSMNPEVNIDSSLRTNWFSLINDTTEDGFETRYSKSNNDQTTMTLLQILLKALKKNVIQKKYVEEQPSVSLKNEGIKKFRNSFKEKMHTTNWFRIPSSSKVYTVAYKTFPIAHYKSPYENLDHFTTITKIRDHQRITNYVDKMIGQSFYYIGLTNPTRKGDSFSEKPTTVKTVHTTEAKSKYNSKYATTKSKAIFSKEENCKNNTKTHNCNCPMKLGEFLRKILSSIEMLLLVQTNTMDFMTGCDDKKAKKLNNKAKFDDQLSIYQIKEDSVLTLKKNKEEKATNYDKDQFKTMQEHLQTNNDYKIDIKHFESSTMMLNDHLDATDIVKIITKPMERKNEYNIIPVKDKNTETVTTKVILLIYEYAIAVEWNLVQRIRGGNRDNDVTNITHDTPFADRLDRSFFGFDQDYYERMPLLVNALQESNYVDPLIEMSKPVTRKPYGKNSTRTFAPDAYRQSKIKKSSPRPFIFEYRSATPLPFRKTYGSRSWVDSYRNAQRLQNIRQVIRYLEKTINAKAGDMHTKLPNSHAPKTISGASVEPTIEKDRSDETNGMEQLQQNSNRVEIYANHNEDPLFNFKPDSPGEVNLLADTFFRFSPVPNLSIIQDTEPNKIPIFRRIPHRIKCKSNNCDDSVEKKLPDIQTFTEHNTELPTSSTKSFSVMLNLYPLKSNSSPEFKRQGEKAKPLVNKIYITTPKPLIQFRKKPAPKRQTHYRYKRPRYLSRNRNNSESKSIIDTAVRKTKYKNNSTTMIVDVDVYSSEQKNGIMNQSTVHYTTSKIPLSSPLPITEKPVELLAGQVEDYHDGSSGLITIQIPEQTEASTSPPIISLFDTTTSSTEVNPWATRATIPPDVFKFSAEDAKVPDHYKNMATTTVPMDSSNMHWETTQTTSIPVGMDRRDMNLDTTHIEMDRKHLNGETTQAILSDLNRRDMNFDTTQMDTINYNWETTQAFPTEIEGRINWETTEVPMGVNGRSMNLVTTQGVPMETIRINMDWATTQAEMGMDSRDMHLETTSVPTAIYKYGHSIEKPVDKFRETLIIKLRNGITTTEKPDFITTEELEETTTSKTYVPQINGHYRNIVAPNNHIRYSAETYRKRKLEMSVTGFRSYAPMYTEIRRNKTNAAADSDFV